MKKKRWKIEEVPKFLQCFCGTSLDLFGQWAVDWGQLTASEWQKLKMADLYVCILSSVHEGF